MMNPWLKNLTTGLIYLAPDDHMKYVLMQATVGEYSDA